MYGLKQYRHFLLGYPFVLRTDHAALTFLMKTPDPVGQSARYLDRLAEYMFEVVHRPGEQHRNADALSRRPCARDPDRPQCRQCGPENSGTLLRSLSSEENALMEAEVETRTDLGQGGSPPVSGRSRSPVGYRHRSRDRSTTSHHWPPERYAAGCKPSGPPLVRSQSWSPAGLRHRTPEWYTANSKSGGDSPGGSSTLEESSSALSDGATLEVNGEMERVRKQAARIFGSGGGFGIGIDSSTLSKEVLLEHQQRDDVTKIICEWIRGPKSPPEASELCATDPEIQALYAQRQSLELVDGILCRNFARPDASIQYQQVVVPRALRTEFIQATHAGAINGHFGVEKSREKLKQVAYWRGWAEDVYYLRPVTAGHRVIDLAVTAEFPAPPHQSSCHNLGD